tara:strand:+ start:27 stop:518 length:492 start_codon:yes stop_codon:yes gene_type:complete
MNKEVLTTLGLVVAVGLAKDFSKSGSAKSDWIKRKGKLGGPGFLSKSKGEQHRLLDDAVQKYGYRSTLGSIMALERSTTIEQRHGEELEELRNWLRGKYGGEGSFYLNNEEILRQHFAIKAGKKIPQTYITHELERYTVLPPELRSPEQNKIVAALEEYLSSK